MINYFAFIIVFTVVLLCLIPVMVIAYWPETYNKVLKTRRRTVHLGRNDRCPCGSGKKLKNCCIDRYNNSYIIERWWYPKAGVKNFSEIFTSLKSKVARMGKRHGKSKLRSKR